MALPKILDRELYTLVKAYEDWLEDKGDLADADLLSAVGEFCRMVRDVIPATRKGLERQGIIPALRRGSSLERGDHAVICEWCWSRAYARELADSAKSQAEHYRDIPREQEALGEQAACPNARPAPPAARTGEGSGGC